VTKIGRNSPCPCGSGKKYKRCCGDKPHPGLDPANIAGVTIDPRAKQVIYVTNDMLINQLRRDAPLIADSFDRLHADDLREMSELLGSASVLLLNGFRRAAENGDDLRTVAAQLAFNALNTFVSSVTLLRNGFCLQAAMLIRSILETLAAVLHLMTTPSDLPLLASNALEIKTTLPSAKRVLPPFGRLYGYFSRGFVHVSSLQGQLQPVVPYDGKSDALEANVGFLRASVWLIYVVVELLFVDLSDSARYWRRLGEGRFAFQPSEDTVRWHESFLRMPTSKSGADGEEE
jgi:hypothetical protein